MSYYKARDCLSAELISMIQNEMQRSVPDFAGGTIYISSKSSNNVRSKGPWNLRYSKALAIIAMHDGFTQEEAAELVGASRNTVVNWRAKYGERVIDALNQLRSARRAVND